ncbi:alkane hydroxylase MAH1-like [Vigna unguiculata]|nr:alkane hydroxylase MAH1-like [Vigna unguiculata]
MFLYIVVSVSIFLSLMFFNIGWRHNRDVPLTNWPIMGMLLGVLQNLSNIHDYTILVLKHHGGTLMFEGPWFTNMNCILTADPMNVHHITSKNFSNYGKGSHLREIFDYFGEGIINSDNLHAWKLERSILHSVLQRETFNTFLRKTILKKLENDLIPFLDHTSEIGTEVDLQFDLRRFTFDIVCSCFLGCDPQSLPNKITQLSHPAYERATVVMEEVLFHRHITPRWLWKLQEWLQIGQEKKFKEAREIFDKFLYECIASKREEKNRCKSTKEVEDTHHDLLGVLMEEGAQKGRVIDDKYLRDTAVTFFAAGSGTISASLSWFFWLVSTHPYVETKILEEIKDNCIDQDGSWIASGVEEFGKLVYLHGAICEALRLFPTVPYDHKCAIKSDTLPSGHHVSPNTMILYSLYAMGRMEQIWGHDCMEFKPERWISESGDIVQIPSHKFIAFNAGPRSCLGKDIAFIEMKMVAVAVLWRFQMQVVDCHPITPRVFVLLTIEQGLKVKVTKRCT